jgi:hypothetical protein
MKIFYFLLAFQQVDELSGERSESASAIGSQLSYDCIPGLQRARALKDSINLRMTPTRPMIQPTG